MSHAELLAQLPDVTKAETGDVHDRKRRLERRPTVTRITIFDIQIARRKVCFLLFFFLVLFPPSFWGGFVACLCVRVWWRLCERDSI